MTLCIELHFGKVNAKYDIMQLAPTEAIVHMSFLCRIIVVQGSQHKSTKEASIVLDDNDVLILLATKQRGQDS